MKKVVAPQGQGLNELYIRFFRMAERRIAEKTGEGVISFISNYGWLDSLSCPGMRERYLETFDSIAIDCLNGDKYKTGKKTPEGLSDPSIFSTPANPAGIQVGTAIATLVRKKDHKPSEAIAFRHLWGTGKRETLAATAEADPATLYENLAPSLPLRLQFMPADVGAGYFDWPRLPELLPVSFAGVKTSRDEFLVDIERETLDARIEQYFDPKISNADLEKAFPALMNRSSRYDPADTRKALTGRNHALGEVVRYAYRPFDVRWAYWDPDTKLIDEKRPEFFGNTGFDNRFLTAGERNRMGVFYKPQSISVLGDHHLVESNVAIFPATVRQDSQNLEPNVAKSLKEALADRGITSSQLFDHILATLNAPTYEIDYIDALRIDWPRIPFPGELNVFATSAELGAKLSALLDAEIEIDGVTRGSLLSGLSVIATPRGKSFEVTAGWGYSQRRENGTRLVMPGSGNTTERAWTDVELDALTQLAARHDLGLDTLLDLIGARAIDVQINADAKWEGVPEKVWEYTLGGYQVLKKWLSYRESAVLGRALTGEEALHFAKTARRITEILCIGPALDAAHAKARDCAVPWVDGKPADTSN